MKRLLVMLLTILLLCGCGSRGVSEKEMIQPVHFYYCADLSGDQISSEAIVAEVRDLGNTPWSVEEILREYAKGPVDSSLSCAFPADVSILGAVLSDGLLTVNADAAIKSVSGVNRTLSISCLVRTMTQFSDIQAVRILAEGKELGGDWSGPWTADDFLLTDDTSTSDATTVKLYFADAEGRYLAEEFRSSQFSSEAEIPAYIVGQLLEGPAETENQMALSDGTRLLGIQVEEGLCTVNFSDDFVRSRPETHGGARLAVFSVVNSLTELPQVERVSFLCAGQEIADYAGMDLTQVFYREENTLGTGRDQSQNMDVNLYVPSMGQTKLASVPCILRRTSGRTQAADVISALLSFEVTNVYENPIPKGTMAMDVSMEGNTCTVTFSSTFALCDTDPMQARLAVRSVVATLCDLDTIDQVVIQIHNAKMTSVDLSQPMRAQSDWLLP